jgi:hypothetical protein
LSFVSIWQSQGAAQRPRAAGAFYRTLSHALCIAEDGVVAAAAARSRGMLFRPPCTTPVARTRHINVAMLFSMLTRTLQRAHPAGHSDGTDAGNAILIADSPARSPRSASPAATPRGRRPRKRQCRYYCSKC